MSSVFLLDTVLYVVVVYNEMGLFFISQPRITYPPFSMPLGEWHASRGIFFGEVVFNILPHRSDEYDGDHDKAEHDSDHLTNLPLMPSSDIVSFQPF